MRPRWITFWRARLGLQWGKASLVLNSFSRSALAESAVMALEQLIGVGAGLKPAPTPVHVIVRSSSYGHQ